MITKKQIYKIRRWVKKHGVKRQYNILCNAELIWHETRIIELQFDKRNIRYKWYREKNRLTIEVNNTTILDTKNTIPDSVILTVYPELSQITKGLMLAIK